MSGFKRWRHTRSAAMMGLAILLALILAGAIAAAAVAESATRHAEDVKVGLADLILAAQEDPIEGYADDQSADDSTDGDFSADDSTDFALYGFDNTNEPDEPDINDVSSDDLSDGDFSTEFTDFAPDVTKAVPSIATLWPADNKMVDIKILGVTDKDGNAVSISITHIYSDEPTTAGGRSQSPDARGLGTSKATVRAERTYQDGRVYIIGFRATDISGCWTQGHVRVSVPGKPGIIARDSGQWYDATQVN